MFHARGGWGVRRWATRHTPTTTKTRLLPANVKQTAECRCFSTADPILFATHTYIAGARPSRATKLHKKKRTEREQERRIRLGTTTWLRHQHVVRKRCTTRQASREHGYSCQCISEGLVPDVDPIQRRRSTFHTRTTHVQELRKRVGAGVQRSAFYPKMPNYHMRKKKFTNATVQCRQQVSDGHLNRIRYRKKSIAAPTWATLVCASFSKPAQIQPTSFLQLQYCR